MIELFSDLRVYFLLHRTDVTNLESPYYLVFLLVAATLFFTFRKSKIILLLFGLAFYASFSAIMTLFILILGLGNYLLGIVIYKKRLKLFLLIGIILNVGVLVYFKYANFFIESINLLPGFEKSDTLTYLVIPLGVSFFTFELVHYIIDIFKGNKPLKNPITFLNFIFFFPTLFAGPIKRFEHFTPQLTYPSINIYEGSVLIVKGLAKKVLLANQLAGFATHGFDWTNNPVVILIGIYAFSLQIYFDFSGYTDIARGSARFFGIEIPENFLSPYFSSSISDFWRKWHVTLMQWFRDYVYIPLGGSRKGEFRKAINILTVFLLSGLWHGASWHFILWGLYHGLLMTVPKPKIKIPRLLMILIVFNLVTFGWILFRSQSIEKAWQLIEKLLTFKNIESLPFEYLLQLLFIGVLLFFYFFVRKLLHTLTIYGISYTISKSIVLGFALALVYLTFTVNSAPFIYFQF